MRRTFKIICRYPGHLRDPNLYLSGSFKTLNLFFAQKMQMRCQNLLMGF
jgi:hypothetical protein